MLHDEKNAPDPMAEYIVEWYIGLSGEHKAQGILPTRAYKEGIPHSQGCP